MVCLRITLVALTLGPLAVAHAGDDAWGARPSQPAAEAAAAQLGRPVAVPLAAAQLDRPRAAATVVADPQVQPALFGPVFRGQSPDAQPLPSGPAVPGDPTPAPRNWARASPEPVPTTPLPAPTPTTVPTPTVLSGPAVVPGPVVVGAPDSGSCDCGCSCGCWWHFPLWTWLHSGADCGCDACCDHGCNAYDACGCEGAGDLNRFYVSGEYLLWRTKGDPLPPLVTAGSASDLLIPGVSAGALDRPGTTTLFGGSDADDRTRSGGRIMAGWWFGDDHVLGIEGGGFWLGRQTDDFTATSFGTPLLTRPFFNVLTGRQDAEFVAEPGNPAVTGVGARPPLAGTVTASASSTFWGDEVNLRTNLCRGPCYFVDLFAGYRGLGLDDSLTVSENLQAFGTAVPFVFSGFDSFKTENRFNGGQVGLAGEWRWNRWSLGYRTSLAIGNDSETVTINGSKTLNGVTSAGDLLTQAGTNIGTFRRNRFAWSPEGSLNVGYQVTDHMRAFVGYDYLYLSSVARAGSQVNLNVNPAPLAGATGGPAQPSFAFHGSDFWAQGLNLGLEFRY